MGKFLDKGGLGFLSGLVDNTLDFFRQKKQYKQQKELQDREFYYNEQAANNAYQRQLDFWNKNNEYNSYANQRSLMEAAGLNPALMYSDGTSGALAGGVSAPEGRGSSQGSAPAFNQVSFLQAVNQAKLTEAQTEYFHTLADKTRGDTKDPQETKRSQMLNNRLLELGIVGKQTENNLNSLDLRFKTEVYDTEVEIREQTAANMRKQYDEMNERILASIKGRKLTDAQIDEISSRIILNEVNAAYAEVRANWHGAISSAQIQQLKAIYEELVSQKSLNEANESLLHFRDEMRRSIREDGTPIPKLLDQLRFFMSAIFGREY